MITGAQPILDALIIGQGLAGSLLAWTLLERGWSLAVIDDGYASSASRVAAGLVNPVTGRRLAKTADVERLLPVAERTYAVLEARLGQRLLHRIPLLRLLRSSAEAGLAERRLADPAYAPYLGGRLAPGLAGPGVLDPLGSLVQRRTGYLDIGALIDHMGEHLRRQGRLLHSHAGAADIRPRAGLIECAGLRAARVICCQGYQAMTDPWWAWLPFQPAKGEILTAESDGPPPEQILSAGRWLLPLGGRRFRLGATYDWDRLDQAPSDRGRETLMRDLPGLVMLSGARVLAHRAGVRPGTLDNAPFIGVHPGQPGLWIFNGFGSKGSLQIPGWAEALADHLEQGAALPARVNIERYAGRAR